jgi:hypothetical protein
MGEGTFRAARAFAAGSDPSAVAVADVNGDGKPDVVTANYGSDDVSVLLGMGDGTFQPARALATTLVGPFSVVVADLGNGHLDIVTASVGNSRRSGFPGDNVGVLLGNGDGSFQTARTFATSFPPTLAVAVADVDGDNRPDLVTANTGDDNVGVLLGNGDGSFRATGTFRTNSEENMVLVADLGNGHPDIITDNQFTNEVIVLLGNGHGSFGPPSVFSAKSRLSQKAVAVADLGNGHPDLITANSDSNDVSVLLGNGDGTFRTARSFATGTRPASVAVADLGDGHPDIVTGNNDGTVSVLRGNGSGTFQDAPLALKTELLPPSGARDGEVSVKVADVNGDRKPDLIAVTDLIILNGSSRAIVSEVIVLLGNGNGTFQGARFFPTGALAQSSPYLPKSVAVADLGNGHPDIVVANPDSNNVSVLLGNGDGTFQAAGTFPTGLGPAAVAVADLGNGHPDIVTVNERSGDIGVLLGNGDGTFQAGPAFSEIPDLGFQMAHPFRDYLHPGDGPFSVAVADVNGDGKPDVVTANFYSNDVSVFPGKGDGTFQPARAFPTGSGPVSVAVADINGDGKPDAVTADLLGDDVAVLLGNGDGAFQAAVSFRTGSGPIAVAVADVNGDDVPDLLTANFTSGSVSVLLGIGNGSFEPTGLFEGPPTPVVVPVSTTTTTLSGLPLPVQLPPVSQPALIATPALVGPSTPSTSTVSSGSGAGPSASSGAEQPVKPDFDPLPGWLAAQPERLDLPTERDILAGLDIARFLVPGTRPQARLDLHQQDTVGALGALLPGETDDPANRKGAAGKAGAGERRDVRPYLMSPVEDTLLGPPDTRQPVLPPLDLTGSPQEADEVAGHRGRAGADRPARSGREPTAPPTAQRLEDGLVLMMAIALICSATAPGTRRGPAVLPIVAWPR